MEVNERFFLQLSLTTLDEKSELYATSFILQFDNIWNRNRQISPIVNSEMRSSHSDRFIFLLQEKGLVL